jgi:hypothetical protein
MVYFNLRKINTCYYTTHFVHEKRQKRMLAGMSKFMYINNVTTVIMDVGFPATLAIRLAIKLKFLFTRCTRFEQCTYLGYILLEAPLRICPSWSTSEHLLTPALFPFGARVRSHAIQRRLFIVLMTAAQISPNVFSLRMFLSNVQQLFHIIHNIACTPILHHIHTYIYIFYFIHLIHIFISSGLLGRLAVLGSLCPIQ